MQYSNSSNKGTAIIITLLLPFAGLIYALRNWRQSWAKNAFWLACIYLGSVMIFQPEGTILGVGGDAGRHVLRLMDMFRDSSISIGSILSSYQKNAQVIDLYQPLVTYLVSRFTDNGHVLFAVFALVYGFFYSRNIWYILEKLPNNKLGYLFILVTLYFLVCPITGINGARMWTALHVYVYGMMPFLLEKDKSKLLWVLITPLIHFSFLYVALFGLLWYFLPYKMKVNSSLFPTIALSFFIVTLFINSISLNAINGMLHEYAPDVYEERLGEYVDEDYAAGISSMNEQKNWYVAMSGNTAHWCYNLLLIALLPCLRRNFKNNEGLMHLYVFSLFLGGFANLMALMPSGGRFQLLSQMFKLPLIIMVAMSIPSKDAFRQYVNIGQVFLLLPFIFEIRKLFDFFSITAILGNFITVFFWENNVPLIDFIKRII